MKRKVFTQILLLLLVVASFSACKKDEPSNPSNNNNNTPAVNRKPQLIADKWITQKVYEDGTEKPSHFLIGSIYQFREDGTYSFTIPNAGNAGGTWSFEGTQQEKLKQVTQAPNPTIWNIITLTDKAFVVDFVSGGKTMKYEFAHP